MGRILHHGRNKATLPFPRVPTSPWKKPVSLATKLALFVTGMGKEEDEGEEGEWSRGMTLHADLHLTSRQPDKERKGDKVRRRFYADPWLHPSQKAGSLFTYASLSSGGESNTASFGWMWRNEVEAVVFGLDVRPVGSKTSDSTRKYQLAVDRKSVDQTGKTLCRGGYWKPAAKK
ncbi:hypothetical protein PAMP_007888 [Pampus punctatissimus]